MAYVFVCAMAIAVGEDLGVSGIKLGISIPSVVFTTMMTVIVVPHNFIQRPNLHVRCFKIFMPFLLFINDDGDERH